MRRFELLLLLSCALAFPGCSREASANSGERVVHVTAKRFEYSPAEIELAKGVPVVLELSSLDCKHGFNAPALKLRAAIEPGTGARLRFTPDRAGRFPFHCDVFCGDGHEDMSGEIVVKE